MDIISVFANTVIMKKSSAQHVHEYVVSLVGKGKRFPNRTDLSDFLGLDRTKATKVFDFLDGKKPRYDAVMDWIDKLGIQVTIPGEEMLDYDFVPKHAAKAGAGASLETSDDVEGLYAFRKDWMANMGIHASRAVMLDVVGDSMEPLLHEGDTLLIDKGDTDIREGKIYVVTLGDELRVKRIYKALNGVILRSENSRYPDVSVEGPDLDALHIHGRVKWCGKML